VKVFQRRTGETGKQDFSSKSQRPTYLFTCRPS